MKPIYLDYNATTPIAPDVADAMRPFLEELFGNPSSAHPYGVQTKRAVDKAREQVAGAIGCVPGEIVFTSGGTESNNHAIIGAALALKDKGRHIITSAVEHPAVIEVCDFLEKHGFETTRLPVDEHGLVSAAELENAITEHTVLITVMHANNEVGSVQPIAEIGRIAQDRGIIMHTDAAQSLGKIPTLVHDLNVDLLSVAGHKIYAPKGVGALYIREGVKLDKLMHGAGHENGRRAGTENVLEIVGLGKACELISRDLEKNARHMTAMRELLHAGLKNNIGEMRLNGHPEKRLPNTLSLSFQHIQANSLLDDTPEIAASPGAACHSGEVHLSHVLQAMAVPAEYAMGTVRFSVGKMTTSEEIGRAVKAVSAAVKRIK